MSARQLDTGQLLVGGNAPAALSELVAPLSAFVPENFPAAQALPQALAARLTGQAGPAIPNAFEPGRFLK